MTKKALDKTASRLTEAAEAAQGQRFGCVWHAIEDTPGQAAVVRLRSDLMIAIAGHIERSGRTQAEAAKVFGVAQPRMSDLIRGKINLFSLDTLVDMLASAGLHVEMRVLEAA